MPTSAFAFQSLAAVAAVLVQPSVALDNGLALTREYTPSVAPGEKVSTGELLASLTAAQRLWATIAGTT